MGTDRIIYIRTDGNSQIASGHLMRCFSIAQACQALGMDVCFLVSDEESASLLKKIISSGGTRNFSITCLKTAVYDHLESEISEVVSLVSDTIVTNRDPIYLIDSYFVTERYLTSLHPFAKTAYLDDLQLFDYPVDLLINYDVIPDSDLPSYKAAYTNAGQLLLGTSYAPLRRQFQNRETTVKKQVSDILITTGGSDPYHFCLKLIPYLQGHAALSGKNLHIVIGALNTDKDALYHLAEKYSFIQLHENVSDMASLMEHCDLAISASGTTLYELCALGIPAISFTMADNQLTSARAFENADVIPYAGDLRTEEGKVLQAVTDFVTRMSQPNLFDLTHRAMRRLVDGNGAMRIASALMDL